jgi:hypothetical protein
VKVPQGEVDMTVLSREDRQAIDELFSSVHVGRCARRAAWGATFAPSIGAFTSVVDCSHAWHAFTPCISGLTSRNRDQGETSIRAALRLSVSRASSLNAKHELQA